LFNVDLFESSPWTQSFFASGVLSLVFSNVDQVFCGGSVAFCYPFCFSILRCCAEYLCHLIKFLVTYIRKLEASFYCDDSVGSCHLEYKICVVRYYHETRKRGSSKDHVILGWLVHDFEFQFFSPVVLAVAKANV
jgi:hypothetical protein